MKKDPSLKNLYLEAFILIHVGSMHSFKQLMEKKSLTGEKPFWHLILTFFLSF